MPLVGSVDYNQILNINDIHKLTPAQGEAKEYYRYGQHNHKPAQCPDKGSKCHGCGKIRHLKRKVQASTTTPAATCDVW